jgi:tRNA-splicing ligase RtcB
VHLGKGATVGSVVPTRGAIIPAAVGVDIGCGMAAVRTTLTASDLPDNLAPLRSGIERAVPVGNGPGGEHRKRPASVDARLDQSGLVPRLDTLRNAHPGLRVDKVDRQLGTLGGGRSSLGVAINDRGQVTGIPRRRNS